MLANLILLTSALRWLHANNLKGCPVIPPSHGWSLLLPKLFLKSGDDKKEVRADRSRDGSGEHRAQGIQSSQPVEIPHNRPRALPGAARLFSADGSAAWAAIGKTAMLGWPGSLVACVPVERGGPGGPAWLHATT
jgi:hypothetical protein